MKNLLEETEAILTKCGKTWDDVKDIGDISSNITISIEQFKHQASRVYDDGFGGPEVNESLVIVGEDWWLERAEYDGSEWWEFKTLPVFDHSLPVAHCTIFY